MRREVYRIKVVPVKHKKSNKWQAEQQGKDPATISSQCANSSPSSVGTLMQIARCPDVEVHEDLSDNLYVVKQKCATCPSLSLGFQFRLKNKKVYLHNDNKKEFSVNSIQSSSESLLKNIRHNTKHIFIVKSLKLIE